MRVEPGEPGFEEVFVLWNGTPLRDCLWADSSTGQAAVLKRDDRNELVFEGDPECFHPVVQVLEGGVITFEGLREGQC